MLIDNSESENMRVE